MPGPVIALQPGETVTLVAVRTDVGPSNPIMLPGMPGWGQWPNVPTHPIMLPGMPGWGQGPGSGQNPVDPGYSPPWAQVPGGGGGQPPGYWGPTDPRPTNPIVNPGNPAWPGGPPRPDQGLPPFPSHPIVIPPTEPPPVQPPTDGDDGNWVWAWSPQAGRWVWVKVPGEGEAGPKA
jgi:hypothetical protein